MPIEWKQDDARQLITVIVTDPYTPEEVLALLDRQAAEGLWHYARIVDFRKVREIVWVDQSIVKERVMKADGGGPSGAVAMIVGRNPTWFREALHHPGGNVGFDDYEVLVTPDQVDDWIKRHARTARTRE